MTCHSKLPRVRYTYYYLIFDDNYYTNYNYLLNYYINYNDNSTDDNNN